jgi:RimJ/RimL family protein N-acetyltransferase
LITLRKATAADCEVVWRLNNDPNARGQSLSTAEIPWPEHEQWFKKALVDPKLTMWMVEVDGSIGGIVRLLERDRAIISVALAPEQRGKGLGSQAIAKACAAHGGPIEALVVIGNDASRRAFEKAGFRVSHDTAINGRAVTVLTWP